MEVSSPLASGIIGFRLGLLQADLAGDWPAPFLLARLFWAVFIGIRISPGIFIFFFFFFFFFFLLLLY